MKHFSLHCILLFSCLAGVSQTDRSHSLSLGIQMPGSRLVDPSTGENLFPRAFPLTFGYSYAHNKYHSFSFVLGGSSAQERTFGTPPDAQILPGYFTLSTRFDYRWTFLGNESRWQPYIGGGVGTTLGILHETAVTEGRTGIFFSMSTMLGLKVNLTDRLFLSTEIPVTFWRSTERDAFESFQLNRRIPDQVIRSIWSSQRNQFWPVISVGVNL